MDFILTDIKQIYRKFLITSIAGALATSIYSFVDAIAVGQAVGPSGTAAMACINPFYGIMVFLSVLCGIGGSVLMGVARGEGNEEKGNAYFSAAILLMSVLTGAAWIVFGLFHEQIFAFFGADALLMPKVMEYAQWLIYTFPIFVMPPFLGAFIRNDGAPNLAMAAVLIGGCTNIFGDWFFVFPMGMGMEGAAVATVIGTSVQTIVMCSYFLRKQCKLRFVKPFHILHGFKKILGIGFGASIFDFGAVFLVILMNNQVMRYSGTSALAVYGAVGTISSLFQMMFCGVGQAIQPIISANFGAKRTDRVQSVWRMSLLTVLIMGLLFTVIGELFPQQIVRLFMRTTPEVLEIAPGIIRPYFLLFLFLGITVLSTYYLQSVMRGKESMIVALMRSIFISGIFLVVLPLWFGILGVWIAMPLSEMIVVVIALFYIRKNKKGD